MQARRHGSIEDARERATFYAGCMASELAPDPVRSVPALRVPFASGSADASKNEIRDVPVETPIGVVYNSVPYAVMMASPADLVDFVYGFSLTEGVIEQPSDIRSIACVPEKDSVTIEIALSGERFSQHLARKRAMSGRTGCGLCGVTDLADLPRARRRSKGAVAIEAAAMAGALAALDGAQPLNARTRAMHAAAYADARGVLRLVREDVGRHNALDKLIGRMMLDRLDPAQGFAVITSRCSFEMVEKAAAAGFGTLVAISAPTSLAIERAQAHGLSLVALARADYAMAFASADASS